MVGPGDAKRATLRFKRAGEKERPCQRSLDFASANTSSALCSDFFDICNQRSVDLTRALKAWIKYWTRCHWPSLAGRLTE